MLASSLLAPLKRARSRSPPTPRVYPRSGPPIIHPERAAFGLQVGSRIDDDRISQIPFQRRPIELVFIGNCRSPQDLGLEFRQRCTGGDAPFDVSHIRTGHFWDDKQNLKY
jgi:hypothetical protein